MADGEFGGIVLLLDLDDAARIAFLQAAFARVRAAATEKIFATKPGESEKREEIYRLVSILDAVERELLAAIGQGNEEIESYIERLGGEGG